jgi:hypothetical protein
VSHAKIKRVHHERQVVCEAQSQNDGICLLCFLAFSGKTKVIQPVRTGRSSVSRIPILSIGIHGDTLQDSPFIRFSWGISHFETPLSVTLSRQVPKRNRVNTVFLFVKCYIFADVLVLAKFPLMGNRPHLAVRIKRAMCPSKYIKAKERT